MEKIKQIVRGKEAREAIRNGVAAVADTVKVTLGPSGRNVLVHRDWRSPRITNDGVLIARNIKVEDECEQLVVESFVQSSKATNDEVGDGTTTSAVIASALVNAGLDILESRSSEVVEGSAVNAMEMNRTILKEGEQVIENLKAQAVPVDGIKGLTDIATVSVEDPELGKTVAEMVNEVGENGFIDVIEGFSGKIETETIKGMKIKAKVPAPFMITNANRMTAEAEDVAVMVTNYRIDNARELGEATRKILSDGTKKLVIFCEYVTEEVLVEIIKAWKSGFQVFILKAPSLMTEEFEDLAAYTGARFINKNNGDKLSKVTSNDLGFVGRIVATDDDSILRGGKEDNSERVAELKDQLKLEKVEAFKNKIKRRISALDAGIGVIHVDASSEVETGYLKLKLEDAVNATLAALQEGTVKGAGLSLKEAASNLPDDSLLKNALDSVHEQIRKNAGGDIEIPDTIIDPVKVERLAVQNACSVAAKLLTTEAIIAETREHEDYEGLKEISSVLIDKK